MLSNLYAQMIFGIRSFFFNSVALVYAFNNNTTNVEGHLLGYTDNLRSFFVSVVLKFFSVQGL